MSNQLLSTYYSDDKQRTAMVFSRGGTFRVCCLHVYYGTEQESYFATLDESEDFAEDWVQA